MNSILCLWMYADVVRYCFVYNKCYLCFQTNKNGASHVSYLCRVVWLRSFCESRQLRGYGTRHRVWFIEDQALSRCMICLLPPPLPLTTVSSTGDTQEDWERETTCWRERLEGVGEEPNHTMAINQHLPVILQLKIQSVTVLLSYRCSTTGKPTRLFRTKRASLDSV